MTSTFHVLCPEHCLSANAKADFNSAETSTIHVACMLVTALLLALIWSINPRHCDSVLLDIVLLEIVQLTPLATTCTITHKRLEVRREVAVLETPILTDTLQQVLLEDLGDMLVPDILLLIRPACFLLLEHVSRVEGRDACGE